MRKKSFFLASGTVLFLVAATLHADELPPPKESAAQHKKERRYRKKVVVRKLTFPSATSRGQILSPGQKPPPTTLRDSAEPDTTQH